MNSFFHLLAGFVGHDVLVWIFIPFIVFVFVGTIVLAGMYWEHQRQKLWHETTRVALEKGLPPPPVPDPEKDPSNKDPASFRPGLVLIAVGIGLFIGLPQISSQIPLVGAYVVTFVGVALIIGSYLHRRDNPKRPK